MRGRMPRTGKEGMYIKRLLKDLMAKYKKQFILVTICLLLTSISQTSAAIFSPKIINEVITPVLKNTAEFSDVSGLLLMYILIMAGLYAIGITSSFIYTRVNAVVTQSFLNDMRKKVFNHMEKLPISYFDRNTHGDIMSVYTNDIDAIRQLVGSSIPNLIHCGMIIFLLIGIMIFYSVWLFLIVVGGIVLMFLTTKYVGGNSGKFFVRQQKTIGKLEGYVEEMMHGAKVVKVFTHEQECKDEFDKINEQLRQDATRANSFGNILGPIMGNIGNIMYITLASVGVMFYLNGVNNLSIAEGWAAMSIGAIVGFLPMSRQFTSNVNSASMQINSIVMAIAGAQRVYTLLDQEVEHDDGYVTLVNAKYDENNNIVECEERTGMWAWKHPHKAEGTITYELLRGDIRMFDVDFGYFEDKIVLHDVTLYAYPGQKVAFVGATGAGKTTITNLINRFYDIADGKIRYDGININKIKKSDLRRSLGIVLQDTNLFTGTVKDNIRYGKLDATDEEIYKAAHIANAYDFITRLPQGFDTMLESDGANLSQGQRQLISIARAAVADAPVMIMDEATSSIDTRTERLVQKGTDQLMHGRTVFVIAHRLSTVQNSDVIMVLDHGRIIERGSHEDLIAKGGTYYQLYTGAFELE